MVGQRLAGNLSSGDTSSVGEYRKKKGVYASAFLKHIKDSFYAFIHKRNCAHLDADHFRGDSSVGRRRQGQGGASTGSHLQKLAAI
jgi:hypothetical protein